MTDRERKSMVRAALILAGAALVRFVVVASGPAEPPLKDRPSIADSLLVAGDSVMEAMERRSRPFVAGETIDLNLAGEEEFDRLPGVGPSKALGIVRDREENGPFASVENLARVTGLGAKSVERLMPFLRVGSAGMVAAAARRSRGGTRSRSSPALGLRPAPRPPGSPGAAGGQIDLNGATADELRALPGIGPVMAERIVSFRAERGGFDKPEDLMEVPGVGAKTFARLASLVTAR